MLFSSSKCWKQVSWAPKLPSMIKVLRFLRKLFTCQDISLNYAKKNRIWSQIYLCWRLMRRHISTWKALCIHTKIYQRDQATNSALVWMTILMSYILLRTMGLLICKAYFFLSVPFISRKQSFTVVNKCLHEI